MERSDLIQMLIYKSQDSQLAKVWMDYINVLVDDNTVLNNNSVKIQNAFNELEHKIHDFDKYKNLSNDNIIFMTILGQVLREI
jgi:hypothetical protein